MDYEPVELGASRRLRVRGRYAATLALLGTLSCQTYGSDTPRDGGADGATQDARGADGGVSPTDAGTPTDAVTPNPDASTPSGASWCDPATWGGTVPTATTDVVIPSGLTVVVDCDAEAHTLEIRAGGTVAASRAHASTLTMHGNLVVRGALDYGTPDDRIPAAVTAQIVFQGMSDASYAGTPSPDDSTIDPGGVGSDSELRPMNLVASDVGLWVLDDGAFRAAGQLKRAWGRLVDGAGPGDATFAIADASGWQVGDRVALTPSATTAEGDHVTQFDEGTVSAVSGNTITLAAAPRYAHAGCASCMRRGEAADLTRNVVVRSFDDTAHAHVMVADRGVAQLDSVELRWLGPTQPCSGGGPARRNPLYFYQQQDASDPSFVRHTSIWGGDNGFLTVERSNGIEISDVAGYDGWGDGFTLWYDPYPCSHRCDRHTFGPRNVVFTDVLAAKLGAPQRVEGCLHLNGSGFIVSGGEGSGALRCVATGVGYGADIDSVDAGGFSWTELGSDRPMDFTFANNVAHDNQACGANIWHNSTLLQTPYDANELWSNDDLGVRHGAYVNDLAWSNLTAADNTGSDFAIIAASSERPRLQHATFDQVMIGSYFSVPTAALILSDVHFSGARTPAITQDHTTCSGGNETDANDAVCIRNWLHFDNPVFPTSVVPFDFGWTQNRNAVWEVRGFHHPNYPDVPADFDLYRRDNHVAGGAMYAAFDAWLVPR